MQSGVPEKGSRAAGKVHDMAPQVGWSGYRLLCLLHFAFGGRKEGDEEQIFFRLRSGCGGEFRRQHEEWCSKSLAEWCRRYAEGEHHTSGRKRSFGPFPVTQDLCVVGGQAHYDRCRSVSHGATRSEVMELGRSFRSSLSSFPRREDRSMGR